MDGSKMTAMDQFQLTTSLDIKLEIYNKRPASLKYRVWTRCLVTIEAIKCLPCFLRFTVKPLDSEKDSFIVNTSGIDAVNHPKAAEAFSVSINIPGVTVSLTTSRTKQYSYGLFWTHNRRNCFIYMAFDMETVCRKHMKWLKKSIKNLEIYRQLLLVQRRNSREAFLKQNGSKATTDAKNASDILKIPNRQKDGSSIKDDSRTLDALPVTPRKADFDDSYKSISQRVSDIYEEIYDGNTFSRRYSRSSVASGIYEEMKPPCSLNFNPIDEEIVNEAPPLPPLPPPRRRLNTFEDKTVNQINRFNSEPEADLLKKKSYRNLLNQLFGTVRSKRTVSESQAGKQLTKNHSKRNIFGGKLNGGDNPSPIPLQNLTANKRNSFSSPDLSKINFIDTFDEDKISERLSRPNSNGIDSGDLNKFDLTSFSLDESSIYLEEREEKLAISTKSMSLESLNFSEGLPTNFNLSAGNTSAVNLVGASGAVPSIQKYSSEKRLIEDDLTGYCAMAPIGSKVKTNRIPTTTASGTKSSSSSSGYATGSCSSSTTSTNSSNTNSTELHKKDKEFSLNGKVAINSDKQTYQLSNNHVYENITANIPALPLDKLNEATFIMKNEKSTTFNKEFSDNLYENLLAMKAEQELQQLEEVQPAKACTSTPTDNENDYQIPRRCHISIDEKLPSYYPNYTVKSTSPKQLLKQTKLWNSPTSSTSQPNNDHENITNILHLRHLINIKTRSDTVENLYISSPRRTAEQQKLLTSKVVDKNHSSSPRSTTTAARKISGSVYEVNLQTKHGQHTKQKNMNNNDLDRQVFERHANDSKEKLHLQNNADVDKNQMLEMAIWQKIDFKFDDNHTKVQMVMPLQIGLTSPTNESAVNESNKTAYTSPSTSSTATTLTPKNGIEKFTAAEDEYEQCYQASKEATRLLHKYASMTPTKHSINCNKSPKHFNVKTQNPPDLLTSTNQTKQINLSPISIASSDSVGYRTPNSTRTLEAFSAKKFASLPRFRKFDLSPIKLRIHNVLQRHQNSQQHQSQF